MASKNSPITLVVRLDNAKYGGGPATVIAICENGADAARHLQTTADQDGCIDDRLRLWSDTTPPAMVGARVSLGGAA